MAQTLLSKESYANSYGGWSNAYQFKLEVIENSISVPENKSNITVNFYGRRCDSPYYEDMWSTSATINVDGSNKSTGSVPTLNSYSYQLLISWTSDVKHGTDGKKTISVSGAYNNPYSVSYMPVSTTVSANVALTDTPQEFSTKPVLSTIGTNAETSISFQWSTPENASQVVCYYKASSATNYQQKSVFTGSSKSSTFIIDSLTPNTPYIFYITATRADSGVSSSSDSVSSSTISYPYIVSISTSELIIGNSQTITIYNPLNRQYRLYMKKDSISGTTLYDSGDVTPTGSGDNKTLTFTPNANTLYASIPNNEIGNTVYYVVSQSQTSATTSGTYRIKRDGSEAPTFNDFTYKDGNEFVSIILGTDQVFVKGLSIPEVTISSANKMVANASSQPSKYSATMSNLNVSNINYSENEITFEMGMVTDNTSQQRLTVTAYDTRGQYKPVSKDITVYDWEKPTIEATATRLNNYENDTTLSISGRYWAVPIQNSATNVVTNMSYRYREVDGTWSAYESGTVVLDTTNNTYRITNEQGYQIVLDLDNSKTYQIEILILDMFDSNEVVLTVDVGKSIFFISSNERKCYINDVQVATLDDVNKFANILIPYTLYENSTGTNGAVTLSDSVSNYEYVDIYFKETWSNYGSFVQRISTSNAYFQLFCNVSRSGSNGFMSMAKGYVFNNNTIQKNQYSNFAGIYFYYYSMSQPQWVYEDDYIYITKVVGYKNVV